MNSICFIPAKGNSRRLPGKNVLTIGGKPLAVRAIEGAIESGCFDKVIVSSNDEKILLMAEDLGAVGLKRSEDLCKEDSRAKDVMYFHLKETADEYENVAMLMPTNPLRTARHIKEAYQKFLENNAKTLVSVCEYKMNPGLAMTIENEKLKSFSGKNLNWVREDEYPVAYHLNGAIFLAKYNYFMDNVTFLDNETVPYVMDRISSVDVDTPDDLKLAQFYLEKVK